MPSIAKTKLENDLRETSDAGICRCMTLRLLHPPQYYFLFLRQNIKRAEQAKGATAFEGFTRLCALSQ